MPPNTHRISRSISCEFRLASRVCTTISYSKGILIVIKISKPAKVKLAVVLLFGSLFAPLAAQAVETGTPTTKASSGTVTLMDTDNYDPCYGDDTATVTSVKAASVILLSDTASAAANGDGATYKYFSETDTALWGADYNYGSTQDQVTCAYRDMNGTVTLSRGRFFASVSPATLSETNTNTTDFLQYIGNTETASAYSGLACGNMGVTHATNVTTSCTTAIQGNYKLLTYATPVQVRTSNVKVGVLGATTGKIYIFVKVLKSAIAAAPVGTSWVATETFTVTSS